MGGRRGGAQTGRGDEQAVISKSVAALQSPAMWASRKCWCTEDEVLRGPTYHRVKGGIGKHQARVVVLLCGWLADSAVRSNSQKS
jgi:hypothetical protein